MSGPLVLDEPIVTLQLVGAGMAGALAVAAAVGVLAWRWLR